MFSGLWSSRIQDGGSNVAKVGPFLFLLTYEEDGL
jgi:hypothetical protein